MTATLADALAEAAARVLDANRARGWTIAVAESCTGGLVAAALTEIAGSSDVFDRGVVTYSNAAKTELLGVDAALINDHGAVSEPVAAAMARGMLDRSSADRAVAITGIAGPGGGSATKPVGTVVFGTARRQSAGMTVSTQVRHFDGASRSLIRLQAALEALSLLMPTPTCPP